MRSKPVFTLMAAAAIGLMLIAGRCSERNDGAATRVETANNAAAGVKSQPAEFSLSAEDDEGFDFPEREEIRQKRKLTPGTKVFIIGLNDARVDSDGKEVFVIGVNGKVKVETADTDTAEVLVVRSVRKREDLQRQKVEISNDKDLFIRIGGGDEPDPVPEIRQRVVLRLPRKAGLEIREIGGDLTVGEIHSHVDVEGVGGNVRVARATGLIKFREINGVVDVTLGPIAGNAVRITNVNGAVNLLFEGPVNADVNAWSINGDINPDLPNVEKLSAEPSTGRLKARIGGGGAIIEINDVNGNVTLSKAANRDGGTKR
jgi:hypothetical protein